MVEQCLGVIPARWASHRFPGKVLAELKGRPLIQHVWERAQKSRKLDALVIACDDERVASAARAFGATAMLTSSQHASGTDRAAEVSRQYRAGVVVNIQGDEPLIDVQVIDDLVDALLKDTTVVMATAVHPCQDMSASRDPNVVKAVVDHKGNALYFSRAAIPFARSASDQPTAFLQHIGVYAYRTAFLQQFVNLPVSVLERTEKLEQLRALEAGYNIRVIETAYTSVGVDTPEDLHRVEKLL